MKKFEQAALGSWSGLAKVRAEGSPILNICVGSVVFVASLSACDFSKELEKRGVPYSEPEVTPLDGEPRNGPIICCGCSGDKRGCGWPIPKL